MKREGIMRRRFTAWPAQVLSATLLLLLTAGCPQAAPSDTLPEEYDVELPDGSVVAARIFTGPAVLANSTWAIHRESDDAFIVRVKFGEFGQIERFLDNSFYHPSHLGSVIYPDGQQHPFRVPSDAQYRAAAYGRSTGNLFGAVMLLHASWNEVHVGVGNAFVLGTVAGNRFEGIFGYHSQINLPFWNPISSEEYAIYGLRELPGM